MNSSIPSSETMPPEPIRIGHYELRDCIGRGGMGLVYRARDTKLDRQVAIKCLRTELFEAHYVERFKREALLLAKLNHPNIVQIYDFIEAPGQVALVMELVDGQNLQLHLREHLVPFAQRMRWLTEIAQGLAVAHESGIIHRDLKAENILINQRNVAKITDLGIAKSQDFNATLTDYVTGSYCSMSPEQAMGEPLDFKSDLFSFGILAYQLLCGSHPFGDAHNKLQLMQRIISHPPISPAKNNPNLPPEISDLLGQLLSKDPENRPGNTHWVAAQLEHLSHLQLAHDFVSDDTQALPPSGSATNQSSVKNTGITNTVRTLDHPTFDTRFAFVNKAPKKSYWLSIRCYLTENKVSAGLGLLSVLLLAAVMAWQLQPKPPKYIAVIPPKITTEDMQNAQQELVKGAIYDAIQQSVIQLDGYHLIPRDEIAGLKGDNETLRRATAADELITTDIACKAEACTITLARLAPENNNNGSRLRALNVRTIDVLTDNYLSIATTTQSTLSNFFSNSQKIVPLNSSEVNYEMFLEANREYISKGASENLLQTLESLDKNTRNMTATQNLYSSIALDLYHETKDSTILLQHENFLVDGTTKNEKIAYLLNLFYLQVTKNEYAAAEETIELIDKITPSQSRSNELHGYLMIAKGEYPAAITYYKKALNSKKSVDLLLSLSNAYRYSGNLTLAKETINAAIAISPEHHKPHSFLGLTFLLEGDTKKAINAFNEAIRKNPADIYSLDSLGLSLMLDKDYEGATETFNKISALAPENPTLTLNRADALQLSGKREEALELYNRVIEELQKNNKKPIDYVALAQAYAHAGQISNALLALKGLEKINPTDPSTLYTAAIVHTLAGNHSSAILNARLSLENGMHWIWFDFEWFDSLCEEKEFIKAIAAAGNPGKCSPPTY